MKHLYILFFLFGAIACNQSTTQVENQDVPAKDWKIVSLKGAYSELLCEFDLCDKILATDVTSLFPEQVKALPKVGHIRNVSVEGMLAFEPNCIVADPNDMKPETLEQLKAMDIDLVLVEQDYSIEGSKKLIQDMANAFEADDSNVQSLISNIDEELSKVQIIENAPKVLFIYARGAGTLMVAGENTQLENIIELAGGQNAASGFEEFKPLTAESLIAFNPDVILMFESGMNSMEGWDGILALPGVAETTAGKDKNFIAMDGAFLSNFGPRIGQAIVQLNQALIDNQIKLAEE
ncbi:MAG: ABC transporter substrate-binding protein [Bacteroidota bacterium]